MDARRQMLTVGPVAENCFLLRREGSDRALIVDPGDEAERILAAIEELGVKRRGDPAHPLPLRPHRRRRPGRQGDRRPRLLPRDRDPDPRRHHGLRPLAPASAPSRATTPTRRSPAARRWSWPGSRSTCIFTPGHSPGHVTYSIRDEEAIFSGDVLFQGSVGRVDLPGGDWADAAGVDPHAGRRPLPTRPPSIPGHMGITTLGAERATNPFLAELAPLARSPAGKVARAVASKFKAPAGTFDVLPERAPRAAPGSRTPRAAIFERAGYGRIETPAFEDTELFARGVGESTDIVQKEMFTFEDQGGRSLTLRPEGTAPICRAYLEHGMHKLPQPVKLWYSGPFFRHERPQAGRYRQFHQIGAEAIGTDSPLADAELIGAARRPARASSGCRGSSCGSAASARSRRARAYLEELQGSPARARGRALEGRPRADRRQPAARLRLRRRGDPGGDGGGADAARPARGRGRRALRARSAPCSTRPGSRTRSTRPWSAASTTTRARSSPSSATGSAPSREIGGGGRYDGLIEQLGGPPTPAIGWAAGIERILLALGEQAEQPPRDVFVAADGRRARPRAGARRRSCAARARSAELDLAGRSLKGQMKQADRVGARTTLILEGDGSAQLRDMQSGEQRPVDPAVDDASSRIGSCEDGAMSD